MTRKHHEAAEPGARESTLLDVLDVLWSRRIQILVFAVAGLLAGLAVVLRRGTIHRAQSRLYVERPQSAVPDKSSFLMAASSRNFANTQAEILGSSRVLSAVLERPEFRKSELLSSVENPLVWLRQELSVEVGRRDDIISVSLDSRHVREACALINEIVREFESQQGQATQSTAETRIEELRQRLKELQDGQRENLERRRSLLRDGRLEGPSGENATELRSRFDPQALQRVALRRDRAAEQADAAEEAHREARALYEHGGVVRESVALRSSPQLGVLLERRSVLEERIFELEAEKRALLVRLAEEHPDVAQKAQSIERLRGEVRRLGQAVETAALSHVESLRRSADAAKEDARRLSEEYERVRREEPELQIAEMELFRLQQEWQASFDESKKLRESLAQLAFGDPAAQRGDEPFVQVLILDRADPANAKIAGGRARILLLGLFLGGLLGAGFAWLRGSRNARVFDAQDLAALSGRTLFGELPRIEELRPETSARELWSRSPGVAEAARALRTAVQFGLPADAARLLQLTSPEQGDGKSISTALLALAMAEAGQRILLVDADLRRPRQFRLFGVPGTRGGLAAALEAGAESRSLAQLVDEEVVPGLDLLCGSAPASDPGELLSRSSLDSFFAQLRADDRYDRILFDSPPVLPVADAGLIAARCDATLLVGREGKTERSRVLRCLAGLEMLHVHVPGVLCNDAREGRGRRPGYDPYGYEDSRSGRLAEGRD